MIGGSKSARRESRHVAAGKKKAARCRDEPALNQAMVCVHRERWLEAMLEKMSFLSEHGVFELCELPAGHKPIQEKWVLKIQRGEGEIERFKARCVAKGLEQIYGIGWLGLQWVDTLRCVLCYLYVLCGTLIRNT